MGRLLLWDIDGTLVNAGNVAAEVFDQAFEEVTGIRPAERVRMSGKTDPQIATEYLEMYGLVDQSELLERIMELLARNLANQQALITEHGEVLPGVAELLDHLSREESVTQSLLTGNILPNAYVKLAALGIDHYFDYEIGAYGSDDIDRTKLVPIALERSRRLRDRHYALDEVWIIGDSENDLRCARAGGVRCLLVATGRSSVVELRGFGGEVVVESLRNVDAILEVLAR